MKLDNGWSILCDFYSDFLLHLTEQVRLCFWNDKDTSHKSEWYWWGPTIKTFQTRNMTENKTGGEIIVTTVIKDINRDDTAQPLSGMI